MKGAAMSELYKAMKRIEDYQSTKPLYKQIAEIKGIASTARYGYDIQPQLTIPKSIAEQADKIAYYALQKEGIEEFRQWFDYKQDGYMDIIYAYLNPLTRDLVKVVEG